VKIRLQQRGDLSDHSIYKIWFLLLEEYVWEYLKNDYYDALKDLEEQ